MSHWRLMRRGVPVSDLPMATIQTFDTALVLSFLKDAIHYNCDPHDVAILLTEARRRQLDHWTVSRLVSPRCACGGPGHYVVGKTTYCGKPACQQQARAHLQGTRGRLVEQRDADAAVRRADSERIRKAHDQLHRFRTAVKRRRR